MSARGWKRLCPSTPPCAAGRWPARTPARAIRRWSPAISAAAPPSTRRSATSPSPMPTRPRRIGRPFSPPSRPAASSPATRRRKKPRACVPGPGLARLTVVPSRCSPTPETAMTAPSRPKRRPLASLWTALLLAFMAGAFLSQPARADALADIKKAGVLKVGIFEDFPPFASAGSDMTLHGYDIDVANDLAKALGVKAQLVGITGQNRIPYLQEHKVDILLSVGQSPEREKVVDFTQSYAPYYIAVLGPPSVAVKSAADLAGKSVGVNRGTLEDSSLTAAAPTADIRRFDNYNGVISAFLSGQVQLIAVGNDVGATVLARHPAVTPEQKFELLTSPDHIALNKNEPALKAALDDAIAKMKSDGTLNKISIEWLQKPLDPKDL